MWRKLENMPKFNTTAVYTMRGYRYCPNNLFDDERAYVSTIHYVISSRGTVMVAPFDPWSMIVSSYLFDAWIRVNCPSNKPFNIAFLDESILESIYKTLIVHPTIRRKLKQIAVMERMIRISSNE